MADGDEKIDHNDRVLVLNRVVCDCALSAPVAPSPFGRPRQRCEAATAIVFDGKTLTWEPRKTRSIQRMEAEHYVEKSTIRTDPMHTYYPVQKLVVVTETGEPVNPEASAEPLSETQCRELAKFGRLDTTHLPADRMLGGHILLDENGEPPTGVALRVNPTGNNLGAPPLAFAPRVADASLDDLQPA
jgi:hypothetical protein